MKTTCLLLILPLLTACAAAPTTTTPVGQPSGGDACGASRYADKIGEPMGDLRYPPGLETRLINPGEMVTMDYNAARMNIEIDNAGRVLAITCG